MTGEPSVPETAPGEPTASSARPARRWWSRSALPAAIVVLGALAVLRTWTRGLDADHRNVLTAVVVLATLLATGLWFALLSPLSRRLRFGLTAVTVLVIAVLALLFGFEGYSGDMLPDRIVFRWARKPDEQLAAAPIETTAGPVETLPTANDYPQFLGPTRRATLPGPQLETDWKRHPPRLVWKQPIGAGWSAFAVQGQLAVTQEQRGDEELVVGYELTSGRIVWSHADARRFSHWLGGDGPRATPTIQGERVYTLGADGLLNCLELATGEKIWARDIVAENGGLPVSWGRSASPLVVDDLAFACPGGPGGKSVAAYAAETGEPVWSGGDDRCSYSSPALATLGGVRQVLVVTENRLVSHRLQDGELLWEHDWPGNSDADASTSQPVAFDSRRVFLSKGYSIGCRLLEVARDAEGRFSARELWSQPARMRTKMTNVVVHEGHVYGLSGGILECVELESGRRRWKRGRYGHGQVLLVGDVLLVTTEQGGVVLVEAKPQRHRELARIQAIQGKTWNNPALAGPYLLVRNHKEAACYELPVVGP